jgi:hypothetical protein
MSEYLDNLINYKIITVYPTLIYIGYLLCRKYYKYMLNYNLLVLDMYDNTYNNTNNNTYDNQIFLNNKIIPSHKNTQNDNYLLAFNEIPT